jgi:preprotein translocase subunit SecA
MGQKDPLLEYKQDGYELFQTLLLRIYEQVIQTLFRVTDPELHKKRQMEVERGEAPKADPLDRLMSQYSYVAADKQADSSFAAFDTRRFDLTGGEDEAQEEAASGNGKSKRKDKKKKSSGAQGPQTVRREGEKVKPNDPCPCGSGKKYKKCCGAQG